jgi:OmpA-OmpF porin, OOP family
MLKACSKTCDKGALTRLGVRCVVCGSLQAIAEAVRSFVPSRTSELALPPSSLDFDCTRSFGMRLPAPIRALARGSLMLFTVCPALATQAQDPAALGTAESTPSGTSAPVGADGATAARDAQRRRELMHRSNTYYGPVGGIHVVEAGSGAPQSFRLQVISDFFFKNDYLYNGDETRYVGGALSLSVTPIEHLELSAAVTTRSLRNKRTMSSLEPFNDNSESIQTIGDPYLNIKSYGEVARGVTLGGDFTVAFLTKAGTDTVDYAGTTFGLRGNLSLDLRRMDGHVPLELRLNAGYVFDDSASIVEDVERERLDQLVASGMSNDASGYDEFRQLSLRHERLAYGINRVDRATIALGLEAPLQLSKRVALHPIAEWELWIPVNRQDYDCSRFQFPDGRKVGGQDSCLADEGVDTFPQRITLGARLFPAVRGLNLLAAVEIGVGGTTNFVRELAPTAPYKVILAASYAVDLKPDPAVTVVKEVEKRVEVPVAAPEGRVLGSVVEQGSNAPVPNARVTFVGRDLSPVISDASGHFASYAFAPGDVQLELEAEGYRPASCGAKIAEQGGDVNTTCELVALPRVGSVAGRVLDANGAPVPGARVQLTGPETRSPVTDADGRFQEVDLPPGDYQARVEQEGFLISVTPAVVEVRKESTLSLALVPKPKKPLVTINKNKLKLAGTIYFNNDTAELQSRSEPLLTEVADTLLRNPALLQVEVQGHTDNVGAAEHNLELSKRRAEAVKDWLVRAGVSPERLLSQGYGLEKPIAPNVGPTGRAKNRRVEFVILQREQVTPDPAAAAPAANKPAAPKPPKAPAAPKPEAAAPAAPGAPAAAPPAPAAPAAPAAPKPPAAAREVEQPVAPRPAVPATTPPPAATNPAPAKPAP